MLGKVLPGIVAMAVIVMASNVLVQFRLGEWLTWGAISYPFAFLVTDLTNRLHGPAVARRVVLVGFVAGLACSVAGTQIEGTFGPLVTWRIAAGSTTAFLTAQLLDVAVFHRLRQGAWWRAPLVSTVFASTVDTAIFFSIAFSAALSWLEPSNDVAWANEALPMLGAGPALPLWVSLAAADLVVKITLALVALVPFRMLVLRLRAG